MNADGSGTHPPRTHGSIKAVRTAALVTHSLTTTAFDVAGTSLHQDPPASVDAHHKQHDPEENEGQGSPERVERGQGKGDEQRQGVRGEDPSHP